MQWFQKYRHFLFLATFLVVGGSVSGCLPKKKSKKTPPATKPFSIVFFADNPFAHNPVVQKTAGDSLAQISPQAGGSTGIVGLTSDNLWALTFCDCSPTFAGKYMRGLATTHGALPEFLVPNIRDQIRSNGKLKSLFSIANFLGPFSSVLINSFAKDSKINEEVRKGISTKLKAALPGGTNFADEVPVTFDLYASPYSDLGNANALAPKTVSIEAQASKWAYLMSLNGLWSKSPESSAPIGYKDHGLQLFTSSVALAELSYMFGLDHTSDGTVYGGLAFDPRKGITAPIGPFDPRKVLDGAGIVSGIYTVAFPSVSAADLAISAKESWTRAGTSVALEEQARVWSAAGMTYEKLKPSARTATTQSIFHPTTGMIPPEAHQLGLAFLPGMAAMLDGPFVDTKYLRIYRSAEIPGVVVENAENREADLTGLTRLARSLIIWNKTLETAEQDQLSDATLAQIKTSRSKLKDALRLCIQTILDHHVNSNLPLSRLASIALTISQRDTNPPPLATAAEALSVLTEADQNIFSGSDEIATDFRKKIIGLNHWFVAEYLAPVAQPNGPKFLDAAGVFWTARAMRVFANYSADQIQAPWLSDLVLEFNQAISDWNARFTTP